MAAWRCGGGLPAAGWQAEKILLSMRHSVTYGTRGRGAIPISTPMMDGQDSDGFRHVIFYYLYKSRDTNTVTTPVGC